MLFYLGTYTQRGGAGVLGCELGAENAMRVEVCERVESPFEWYILFRNADGGEGEALWWKFSKQLAGEGDAEYLSVAPESILLLRDAFGEHGLNG